MGAFKHITNESYDDIKALLSYGITNTKVARITGFSPSTVGRVKATKDYADFKRYLKEIFSKDEIPSSQIFIEGADYDIVAHSELLSNGYRTVIVRSTEGL
jgi:hypothetical protein